MRQQVEVAKQRLGLDIGTNSIGWCLTEYDDAHTSGTRIVDIGVRIFSDGRDPQSGTSLAVDRRDARSARRRRDRLIGCRDAFLEALVQFGLMPANPEHNASGARPRAPGRQHPELGSDAKKLVDLDPYRLRAEALDRRLEPYEIGRALFHLNQRRGFKSNRKAERKQKDADGGKIAPAAELLDRAISDAEVDTLGQFLHGRVSRKDERGNPDPLPARVRMNSDAQGYDFYPQRRHYEYEFDRIWEEQAKHHPDVLTETARIALHRILFFQRPLKEQIVGKCTFVNSEDRLPRAHPLFQERRLYEEVNQLEVTTPGEASRKLNMDERDLLVLQLRTARKKSFEALGKLLKLQSGQSFNKASATRLDLAGDEIYAAMADKKRFGDRWPNLSRDEQWEIVEQVQNEESPEALHDWLTGRWGLDEAHAEAVAKANLPEGHGRLGETATRLVLEQLKTGHEDGAPLTYNQAVERCGWHHSEKEKVEIAQLPYYGQLLSREIPPGTQLASDPPEKRWGKITNPTVHIGLRQLEKLVNAVIQVHGRPDEIVVELARELKLNEKDKEEHNKRIRRDTAAAIARGEKLAQEGFTDNGANRMLMRMWEELNPHNPLDRRCPYCGEPIGMRQLFSSEADIDHIIPYSRSLDDSAGNKVVAHRGCNRTKGNRTPWEKWGGTDRWDTITAQVARLHKSKQWRFGPDAMARVEKDGGFIARQLTDTQYLSRMARTYVSSLYADKDEGSVYVIPGRMTAMLRRLWGLNSLLPDHNFVDNKHSDTPKNRLDHRHHAIDAAVTAVTTRGLLNEIARTAGQAEDRDLDRLFPDLKQPWDGFRDELRDKLAAVTVSHKPDHGRKGKPKPGHDTTAGRLHNDTAYGFTGDMAPDGKTPIVVHRVPLMSLKPGDFSNPDRIPDSLLRDALHSATDGLTGKEYERALARFRDEHPDYKGIRRVRVREPLNVIPVRDKNGRAYKGYKGDSNARFDVWRLPDGKWTCDVVSMFGVHQRQDGDRRPHPAAKKILSLRQNDVIAVNRDGGPTENLLITGFNQQGRLTLCRLNETGNLKVRDATQNESDPFKYVYMSPGSLKKASARQVRIDPLGRVFDPGPR